MKNLYWATTYFMIGYVIIVGIVVTLSSVPGQLIRVFSFVLSSVIFTEMALRYFKRCGNKGKTLNTAVVLGIYWGLLSITLDIDLMVLLLPLVNTGQISWSFFAQQSYLYWMQFPLLLISSFAASLIYVKLASIQGALKKIRP